MSVLIAKCVSSQFRWQREKINSNLLLLVGSHVRVDRRHSISSLGAHIALHSITLSLCRLCVVYINALHLHSFAGVDTKSEARTHTATHHMHVNIDEYSLWRPMENRYQSANTEFGNMSRKKNKLLRWSIQQIETRHWFATDPQIIKSIFGCRFNSARQAVGNCFVHIRSRQSLPIYSEAETQKQSGRIVCFGYLFVFYFHPSIRVYAACVCCVSRVFVLIV